MICGRTFAPDASGDVSTWGALRDLGVFLKGDAPGRFTMTGSAVAVASDGVSVGVSCVRQAARVRLMSVKVDFGGLQVSQALLQNFYWFDNSLWVLNKIINYSLTTWDDTECEFLKLK